jgi:hypothetical protein
MFPFIKKYLLKILSLQNSADFYWLFLKLFDHKFNTSSYGIIIKLILAILMNHLTFWHADVPYHKWRQGAENQDVYTLVWC